MSTPYDEPAAEVTGDNPADLWGALRGTVVVASETDLTRPTGEVWDAER